MPNQFYSGYQCCFRSRPNVRTRPFCLLTHGILNNSVFQVLMIKTLEINI